MKCILVVDDDAMNLRMAEFILKKHSFRVITAVSGAEGIEKLKAEHVDLLLLDIEMPVMDGIKTLELIRKESRFADLPVIFLTASGDKNDVLQAYAMGSVDYVKKPFLPEELVERVNKVFQ